jgi:hypothetical protein
MDGAIPPLPNTSPWREALLSIGTTLHFNLSSEVTIRSENWCGAKMGKDATKKLFSDGIKKPVKLWNRCVEAERDYVEK